MQQSYMSYIGYIQHGNTFYSLRLSLFLYFGQILASQKYLAGDEFTKPYLFIRWKKNGVLLLAHKKHTEGKFIWQNPLYYV